MPWRSAPSLIMKVMIKQIIVAREAVSNRRGAHYLPAAGFGNVYGPPQNDNGTEMYGDYWRQREGRFNKFLTREQQKKWAEMTGEPYRFQPVFRR